MKQIPWLSLILLLLTYLALGWVISKAHIPSGIWILTITAIVTLAATLTRPWTMSANYFDKLLKSNFRSFCLTLVGAFLFFLILARFRLFLDILVILSASLLARIEFQALGFQESKSFWIITICSLSGLGLGVLLEQFMARYLL
ncbi:hypothetical protein [Calothrix sp. 336/3]|uniref:hypothetical protein n=1 Tax=Calothrix sp. 336/3 TaxID=1337936 RepID=UPI0004E323B6|nr:hypothetical protein [Calothrix sp. 336/3]AKG23992.1 hypothetical protein IJ00_24185 [Calothrix sp. 336/3]